MNQKQAMILDDEPDLREVVSMALQASGFAVRETGEPRVALEWFREQPPDLLVIDLMMPGMTGVEFCRRMEAEIRAHGVAVLMISGVNPRSKAVQEFRDLPLPRKAFVAKPFDPLALVEQARQLLGEGSAAPAPKPAAAAPRPLVSAPLGGGAAPEAPEHRGYRILLIDDDPDILQIMGTVLGAYFKIQTASNGMEALEQIDRFYPDLILSDINMPVMNGLECAKAIRKHPTMPDLPIFFLTGETDQNLPRLAYDLGANLYLRKPLDPFRAMRLIDHFLGEERMEREGNYKRLAGAAPPVPRPAAPAAPAPVAAPPQAVRVLVVDRTETYLQRVASLLQSLPAALEVLTVNDEHDALVNIARWQPDVILYQPREARFDGLAFSQMVRLRHQAAAITWGLIGIRFLETEIDHSRRHLGREVIDLNQGESALRETLAEVVRAAQPKIGPKQQSFAQIEAERAKTSQERAVRHQREHKQHDLLLKRYQGIQEFIDGQL